MSAISTLPKPFVFVLMPLDPSFSDIYKFGIKGAAEDVGAYAERVDEQIFTEGILDRIFNQVSKSDVVVADMTGRNSNVFYEVGYAHALGKVVLLLTQAVEDIPFDLKHRQHIVYGGKIEILRRDLAQRLRWAIEEGQRVKRPPRSERLTLFLLGVEVPESGKVADVPALEGRVTERNFWVPLQLRNDSAESLGPISHVYLLSKSSASLVPTAQESAWLHPSPYAVYTAPTIPQPPPPTLEPLSAGVLGSAEDFDAQFRLPASFPSMPPGAVEVAYAGFELRAGITESDDHFRLRLFSPAGFHDFDFRIRVGMGSEAEDAGGAR